MQQWNGFWVVSNYYLTTYLHELSELLAMFKKWYVNDVKNLLKVAKYVPHFSTIKRHVCLFPTYLPPALSHISRIGSYQIIY